MRKEKRTVKTYISLQSLHLSTEVVDKEGVKHRISFSNGIKYPSRLNGRFTTDSSSLQEAIECDADFGICFGLHGETEIDVVLGGKEAKPEEPIAEPKVGHVVEDCYGVVEVREYILNNYPDTDPKDISNKDKVLALANELGLSFPNLSNKRD